MSHLQSIHVHSGHFEEVLPWEISHCHFSSAMLYARWNHAAIRDHPLLLFQNHVSIHAVHIDNHAVYITLKTVAMRDHQSLPSFKSNCSCMPWVSSEMGAAIKGHQSQPTVSIFERNEGREKWSSEMGVAIKGHQLQPTVSIFLTQWRLWEMVQWNGCCHQRSPITANSIHFWTQWRTWEMALPVDVYSDCHFTPILHLDPHMQSTLCEMTHSSETMGSTVIWLINILFMYTVNVLHQVGAVTTGLQ